MKLISNNCLPTHTKSHRHSQDRATSVPEAPRQDHSPYKETRAPRRIFSHTGRTYNWCRSTTGRPGVINHAIEWMTRRLCRFAAKAGCSDWFGSFAGFLCIVRARPISPSLAVTSLLCHIYIFFFSLLMMIEFILVFHSRDLDIVDS